MWLHSTGPLTEIDWEARQASSNWRSPYEGDNRVRHHWNTYSWGFEVFWMPSWQTPTRYCHYGVQACHPVSNEPPWQRFMMSGQHKSFHAPSFLKFSRSLVVYHKCGQQMTNLIWSWICLSWINMTCQMGMVIKMGDMFATTLSVKDSTRPSWDSMSRRHNRDGWVEK